MKNRALARKIKHDLKARDRALARARRPSGGGADFGRVRNSHVTPRLTPRIARQQLDIWPTSPLRAYGLANAQVVIPETFSFISNPDDTLDTLIQLRKLLGVGTLRSVQLDYSRCKHLDLCASVVQDVLALRGRRQAAFRGRKLAVNGIFSKNPQIDLMLVSSGILKHLKHPISKDIPPQILDRLRFSPLRIGNPSPPKVTSNTELAASSLADFFDDCLRTEHHRLKPVWKGSLIQLITEVLDNAEEHGNGERLWHTIGYYNRSEAENEGGECHIALFNFGESFFESLSRPETSPVLKRQIAELATEHRRRGYFGFVSGAVGILWPIWDEESLWTLYALQEGVSRFTNQPEGVDRGNGTVKMIEFFSELASGQPQMALVSGKTHILFDGRYSIAPVDIGGETRQVIAFNEKNDLRERPDHNYVRTLRQKFPGTLISLRFQLRQADLAEIKEKLDSDGHDN